jgi:hypothetical protein
MTLAGPDVNLFRGISFFLFGLFFLSVNVTVHILNIATCQEPPRRQLGDRSVTHGQEPTLDLRWGLVWKADSGWLRDRPLFQKKTPQGQLGAAVREAGFGTVWPLLLPTCVM